MLEPYIDTTIDLRLYMLCLLPPLLVINMIRNLKFLAPLSMVANVCIVMGVVITFYYTTQDIPPLSSRLYVAPLSKIPLFFGTAIFALEGIGVVSKQISKKVIFKCTLSNVHFSPFHIQGVYKVPYPHLNFKQNK